jgi:hypothetical protein
MSLRSYSDSTSSWSYFALARGSTEGQKITPILQLPIWLALSLESCARVGSTGQMLVFLYVHHRVLAAWSMKLAENMIAELMLLHCLLCRPDLFNDRR